YTPQTPTCLIKISSRFLYRPPIHKSATTTTIPTYRTLPAYRTHSHRQELTHLSTIPTPCISLHMTFLQEQGATLMLRSRLIFRDGALDPLQAETHAMVLAAKIINTLQTNRVHYFTDASILATNLQKQDPVTQAADWRNRALLAEFLSASQQSTYRVTKIPRRKNVTAHALAAQARTQADTPACLFVCNNPTHTSSCVVQLNLQNILWGACRLISVSCF
ncbi:unnamed protein product, partial [Urochloa humidicola]